MERSLPYIMETTIKQIEDMSLNAWPSHKMELYDGWILRFSYFYTHRTNSVEQFGNSTLTWRKKSHIVKAYISVWEPPLYLRSVLLSLLTLIMFWRIGDMPSSIPPMSWQ